MLVWTELFIILVLILVSGVFAGAEIALLSVRKTRLAELVAGGRRAAAAALELRKEPERLLATIQVAITLLGAATAVFGGARLEEPLAAAFSRLGVREPYADTLSFVVVVAGISYFSLVFGELVPKSLALRKGERFTLLISRGLMLMSRLVRPAVWLLTRSSNLVLRPFRDSTTFSESRLSPDELQQLVEEASSSGSLSEAAGEIASRAIDLAELRIKDIMVPRGRIVGIAAAAAREQVRDILRDSPHSRYPVFATTIDDVLGYVTARDVYEALVGHAPLEVRALMRPVVFLPVMAPAVQAMRKLQEQHQRFGVVVDETGGVVGIATIGDVAEELLGEVLSEHEAAEQLTVSEDDGALLVRGDAPIHELERVLDVSFSEDDSRASTVAGLVIEQLGRIPAPGERLPLGAEIEVEIVDASNRRVRTLRLRRQSEPTEEPA